MRKSTSPRRSAARTRRPERFPLDPGLLTQRPLAEPDVENLPVVRIKSQTRHPTIFRKRIDDVSPTARHGDLVRVVTVSGEPVGFGFWNPRAEATVRLLCRDEGVPLDQWWDDRLRRALDLRREVFPLESVTTACRLINAEGDGFPGLTADRLGELLSLETFTLGMYQRGEALARRLAELAGCEHWVVRPGPHTLEQEGFVADGFASAGAPGKVLVEEHGVRFEVHPGAGHKTGFFCDQRENRRRLREFCEGRSVLDACCYSGGFALNAALANAAEVTAVDLDEEAIRLAKRNAQLNHQRIKLVQADAFSYLRDMQRNQRQFDVLVLDPPKLIRHRDEAGEGRSKYFDLNRLAISCVRPGGVLLTCSCSGLLPMDEFTRLVRAACSGREAQLLLRSGADVDHPVALDCLETEYLKCLWMRL